MNAVIGFSGLLLDGTLGEISEQQRRAISIVRQSCQQLLELISELLDVANIEAGRIRVARSPVFLATIIAEQCDALRQQATARQLQLTNRMIDDDITVLGDRARIGQVVRNLIENAMKFTEQGSVDVRAGVCNGMARVEVRMRDEAEIRGHPRTYIGARPGRIIQGVKTPGSNNPVFILDEVDKIGMDFRGDPAAALLEVLDPEQNHSFSDHYLNVPFDLSRVMFITTANLVDPIPSALKDRMEIIRLAGYTEEEKLKIAQGFLLPRQIRENGLQAGDLQISSEVLKEIILHYTQEAGLRNLEREISSLCRKVARRVAEGEKGPFAITRANLHRYLGPPRFLPEKELERDEVGVATGLAWTQVGGEILAVEAILLRGKGQLTLTGQLGEVMRESAQAALSYARTPAGPGRRDALPGSRPSWGRTGAWPMRGRC